MNKEKTKKDDKITFKRDIAGRKEFCDKIKKRILKEYQSLQEEGYSVSINGSYGTGKTWLLKMWMEDLKDQGFSVEYLDIWKDEIFGNPLISFSDTILKTFQDDKIIEQAKKQFLEISNSIVSIKTLGRVFASVLKNNTGIEINLDGGNVFGEYTKLKKTINKVKSVIQDQVEKEGRKKPLFIFVDELDRVKPPFALQVLEIIKHFLNIPGVVFIFAVNKEQIEISIKHNYGTEMDTEGYYRRFFKLQAKIPEIDYERFVDHLYKKEKWNFLTRMDTIVFKIFILLYHRSIFHSEILRIYIAQFRIFSEEKHIMNTGLFWI